MKAAWSALVGLIWITPAMSQEVCTGILKYAGRDETAESQDTIIAQHIYREHCQGSSARRESSTSAGLDAVVKAIPIRFSFGSGSSSERLANFCKKSTDENLMYQSVDIRRSTVVREALNTFSDCIRFANKNIFFEPVIGRTQFTVAVRRGSEPVQIQGVKYNKSELSCTVPNTDDKTETIGADENTRKRIDAYSYPIHCTRLGVPRQDGGVQYPRAELTILTDRDPFLISVPHDEVVPEQWASEISKRVQELEVVRETAIGQCKVELEAQWGNCAPSQKTGAPSPQPYWMPIVSSGFTPVRGGISTWTPWQIASEWDSAPWNCVRARLVCTPVNKPQP